MATHNLIYEDPIIIFRIISRLDENKVIRFGQPIHNHPYRVIFAFVSETNLLRNPYSCPTSKYELIFLVVNHPNFDVRLSLVGNFDT